MEIKNRNAMYDNLKSLLMFLVVFGHFIEEIRFQDAALESVYNFIYLFHMPLFVFCSGAFAKIDVQRIFKRLLFPYIIFQVLYGLFDIYIMKSGEPFTLTNCYYTLWYLLALAVWSFSIPLFKTENKKKRIGILMLSAVIGLAAGYFDFIGKELSLSRILVFFPFFILGYYMNQPKNLIEELMDTIKKNKGLFRTASVVVILGAFVGMFVLRDSINTWALFEYTSYRTQGYHLLYRMIHYIAAFLLSAAFICLIPKQKNWFPQIAQNTFQIYIIHVLVVKLVAKYGWDNLIPNTPGRIIMALLFTMAILYLCSRRWVTKFLRF